MIKDSIHHLIDDSLSRAQRYFEKKSGWSAQQTSRTVGKIHNLDALERMLLGGLVVGRYLKGTKVVPKKRRATRRTASH